jgi:glycosyltransferase involved in cell wall biosynthesis
MNVLQHRAPGDRAMKVMFLLYDLGSGGTSRVTALLANGFAARGIDCSLVVCRAEGVLAPMLDPRVRLITIPGPRMKRNAGLLLDLPGLVEILRREQPDVVVSSANHMHVLAVLACRVARLAGARLVLKMTNSVLRGRRGRLARALRRAFYRRAFRQADAILAITASAQEELRDIAPEAAGKLAIVDNPYITDAMTAAGRQRNGFAHGRLLAVGRLVPQKGYDLLLDALARLKTLDWRLDVLGDGPLLEALQRQARQLGIAERIAFHGFVPDPVPSFRRAHALVLSSRWEGQGAVLLEALACGCPVVAVRSTEAVAEALGGGRYGRLTPPGDAAALADAIAATLRTEACATAEATDWVARYRIDAGIESHARALGVSLSPLQARAAVVS